MSNSRPIITAELAIFKCQIPLTPLPPSPLTALPLRPLLIPPYTYFSFILYLSSCMPPISSSSLTLFPPVIGTTHNYHHSSMSRETHLLSCTYKLSSNYTIVFPPIRQPKYPLIISPTLQYLLNPRISSYRTFAYPPFKSRYFLLSNLRNSFYQAFIFPCIKPRYFLLSNPHISSNQSANTVYPNNKHQYFLLTKPPITPPKGALATAKPNVGSIDENFVAAR